MDARIAGYMYLDAASHLVAMRIPAGCATPTGSGRPELAIDFSDCYDHVVQVFPNS